MDYINLPKKYNRESTHHRAMKGSVVDYLKNIGEPNPLLEYGYLDVYAPTLGVVVECGDTPVSRIISVVNNFENLKELWTVDIDFGKNDNYELIVFRKKTVENTMSKC